MDGKAPDGIITDQDRAMQNAIEVVFPNTKHRWCIWHIMKKIPDKLRGYKDFHLICSSLHNVVYESLNPAEFECNWKSMIDQYGLGENNWLDGLYSERRRWVPAYVKTSFWAGMSSTQRSESINAFFDGYVNSKTSLKVFVEQYNVALRDKVEKEAKEDFNSYHFDFPCVSAFEIEKQLRDVYTLSKFKEFQREMIGKLNCELRDFREFGNMYEYTISECKALGGKERTDHYKVEFQPTECEFKCNCLFFEFRGLLCRHILMVLCRNKVKVIPDKYILRRWRKDVRRSHTKISVNYGGWDMTPEQRRYDAMCLAFTELADLASTDENCTSYVQACIKKCKLKVEARDKMGSSSGTSNSKGGYTVDCEDNARDDIRDPAEYKSKGRPREKRLKKKIYKSKKKSSKSEMPTSDPPTKESTLSANVAAKNMYFTPEARVSNMDLLQGMYHPQPYFPQGMYPPQPYFPQEMYHPQTYFSQGAYSESDGCGSSSSFHFRIE